MLLAIETSCDETAVAVFDSAAYLSGRLSLYDSLLVDLISSQIKLHEPYGGVVPEIAARAHIKNLPLIFNQALERSGIEPGQITALAVTQGPGLKGSLLVGLCFAKAFALSRNIPLLALNHLEGHVFSCELCIDSEKQKPLGSPELPMLALIVSGGHTELIYIKEFRSYEIIARTRDDAAGEAFDKTASLLGLPYPGGPALSKYAKNGNEQAYELPQGMPNDMSAFSFSGLKTAVLRKVQTLQEAINEEQVINDLAASVQFVINTSLVEKVMFHCKQIKPKSLLLTGGVAANQQLRSMLADGANRVGIKFYVPPSKWCTDNAAMIGALALQIIKRKPEVFTKWSELALSEKGAKLGPDTPNNVAAQARWPLDELFSNIAVGNL